MKKDFVKQFHRKYNTKYLNNSFRLVLTNLWNSGKLHQEHLTHCQHPIFNTIL